MGERRLICFAVIYTYLLHIGQNHKHIGIGLFGEKAADQVFLDDRAGTAQLTALFHDRNTAAATGNDDLAEYDFGEDEDDEDEPTPEDEEPAQDKEE